MTLHVEAGKVYYLRMIFEEVTASGRIKLSRTHKGGAVSPFLFGPQQFASEEIASGWSV